MEWVKGAFPTGAEAEKNRVLHKWLREYLSKGTGAVAKPVDKPMYAACFKDEHGGLAFFDGPNPSLDVLLYKSTPPEGGVGTAYIVKLENDTVTPMARWDGVDWKRKKERQ